MNIQSAQFHLNTTDILNSLTVGDYPVINQYGSVNTIKTDYTWNNIDFHTILGDMYDKFEKFNIKLCSVNYAQQAIYGTTLNDRNLSINIYGLPFSNCTYESKVNSNVSFFNSGSITLVQNAAGQAYLQDSNMCTIYSPRSPCNIRINLSLIDSSTPGTGAATIYPHLCFYFRIYGIEKD